ncbi:MAG: hypothetical protein AAGL89_19070 [Pseudomonadota bacterium]
MKLVQKTNTDLPQPGNHRFVVNLVAKPRHTVEVRSCEVISANHRNRFSFPLAFSLDEIFVPEVARGISGCLSSLSDKTEVVSLPTLTIEIPGLSLAMAHLIATKAEDGSVAIILRFKMLLGSVSYAFRSNLGIDSSVSDHTAHTSALVLTDIVMPLLDLCSAAEAQGLQNPQDVQSFLDTLVERSAEVRFQAELIKRFVASASQTKGKKRPEITEAAAATMIGKGRFPINK